MVQPRNWPETGTRTVASTVTPSDASKTTTMRLLPSRRPRSPPADVTPLPATPRTPISSEKFLRPVAAAATTGPVQIPSRSKRDNAAVAHPGHRRSGQPRSRRAQAMSPDSLPQSVAALLAATDIPRPNTLRRGRKGSLAASIGSVTESKPSTPLPSDRKWARSRGGQPYVALDATISRRQASLETPSTPLSRRPLDLLLSPPEYLLGSDDDEDDVTDDPGNEDDDGDKDYDDDDDDTDGASILESALGSVLSTRTVSLESMPSLLGETPSDPLSPSIYSPRTPSPRGRRSLPKRLSFEPVSSPPGEPDWHPLSRDQPSSPTPVVDVDQLDFRVFHTPGASDSSDDEVSSAKSSSGIPFLPLRSAFKSNLTASLRALRVAARSISSLNLTSIPPDDFLTRSILTIDPRVPYTDEKRPPVLDDAPSAALRRYLNPTTGPQRPETRPSALSPVAATNYTASIQMQTYKVQRSRSAPPSSSRSSSPYSHSSSLPGSTSSAYQPQPQSPGQTAFSSPPGVMRQREMRENSDFIRIAVLEMAMRKRGKLADDRPGRARWALPPRKPTRPCEVRLDGVPVRWVPVTV